MAKYLILLFLAPILLKTTNNSKVGHPNYWDSSRVYTYSAIFIDSTGDTLSEEIVKLKPTGEVWEKAPNQTLVSILLDFNADDSAKLAPYPANGIKLPWFRHYKEGAIQDSSKVWIHPVRANQYIITELAPFPEVRFPLKEDKSWSAGLTVFESFGSFEGHIDKFYNVNKVVNRNYVFGNLECWEIKAESIHDRLGSSRLTYYFNNEYGFTEMNYHFYNNKRLEFKLIELIK